MDHTFVDEKSLKKLEDYAVLLTMGMLSLETLQNIQVHAVKIGILTEDLNERANTIVWDIRRQLKLYQTQLKTVLSLVPNDFNVETIIQSMKIQEMKKARSMLRKSPMVKNEKQ